MHSQFMKGEESRKGRFRAQSYERCFLYCNCPAGVIDKFAIKDVPGKEQYVHQELSREIESGVYKLKE